MAYEGKSTKKNRGKKLCNECVCVSVDTSEQCLYVWLH